MAEPSLVPRDGSWNAALGALGPASACPPDLSDVSQELLPRDLPKVGLFALWRLPQAAKCPEREFYGDRRLPGQNQSCYRKTDSLVY